MEGAFSFLSNTISSVSDKFLVERATSDDSNVTPGYIYQEISQQTHESAQACTKIVEDLLQKLRNNSPFVRIKTLKVIKHIILKGHETALHLLRSNAEQLRPSLSFSGPQDPLKGDSAFKQIREEAKEVMQLLFSENIQRKTPINTSTSPKSYKESHNSENDHISSHDEHLPKDNNSNLSTFTSFLQSFIPVEKSGLSNFGVPVAANQLQVDFTVRSKDGGWNLKSVNGESSNHNSKENQLIEECTSGSSVSMPYSVISSFLKRAAPLNLQMICQILIEKLESNIHWQTKLKALALIEALLQEESLKLIPLFVLSKKIDIVKQQLESVQKSVKDKAAKILQIVEANPLPDHILSTMAITPSNTNSNNSTTAENTIITPTNNNTATISIIDAPTTKEETILIDLQETATIIKKNVSASTADELLTLDATTFKDNNKLPLEPFSSPFEFPPKDSFDFVSDIITNQQKDT